LRALDRAVTLEDYEALTQNIDGVLRAKATYNSILREVTVYVLPVGGGQISTPLKLEIEEYLLARNCLGTDVVASSATYIECVIAGEVTVLQNYTQASVQIAVEQKLADFFDLAGAFVGFGVSVYKSDIYRAIDEVEGVDHVDLDELHIDAISTLILNQWSGGTTYATTTGAKFATDTINTLVAAVEETITLTFTSPTAFNVLGSVSGPQASAGTVGVAYTAQNGFGQDMFSFTVAAGVTPMVTGDNCQFRTSQQFENIPIGDHEIVTLKTPLALTYVGGA
jgi:hypothetical protein